MENVQKIVRFDIFCSDCKHRDKDESESPCCDCLKESVNTESHKPIKFEEDN